MEDHVGIVAQPGMEGVVLEMGRVEVNSSKLIASVFSDNSLEIVHGEEIGVVPRRCDEGG